MFGVLGLVVRLVGGIEIRLADLHDPAFPPLTEVELFCAKHPDGWTMHVWPVNPPCYQPCVPSNERQAELLDRLAVVAAVTR
jgi:hypothetical protein